MNFAYIDDPEPTFNSVPTDGNVSADLVERLNVIKTFRQDYHKKISEALSVQGEICDLTRKIVLLRTSINQFDKEDVRDCVARVTGMMSDRVDEQTEALQQIETDAHAMKAVLGREALPSQFLCFVCLENSVDTFLDPCGHVICESCWRRSTMTGRSFACPGCRTIVKEPKKMFMLS